MPVEHAREGCEKIAQNVIELVRSASYLLNMNDETAHRRQAYVLIIHAIDEAGKMIRIIKEMIAAESNGCKAITITGFYSHKRKGSEAAAIGLVAIDWFDELLKTRTAEFEESEDKDSLERYRSHLETLRREFDGERERVLYVDYENGKWLQPISANEVDIILDAHLLSLTAIIVQSSLKAGKTFREVSDTIQQVQDSMKKFFREYADTT
ncbi:MAG: AbiV family abortive infection protein [Candidatus Thermoplasmatota archaeon]|nr:AbiV family abortive infection protein [Candidatus Thermoplasmatota archaeon]